MKLKKITPKIFYTEDGEKMGVELRYQDFEYLIEKLEDLYDVRAAYEVMSKPFKTVPFEVVEREIFGSK